MTNLILISISICLKEIEFMELCSQIIEHLFPHLEQCKGSARGIKNVGFKSQFCHPLFFSPKPLKRVTSLLNISFLFVKWR